MSKQVELDEETRNLLMQGMSVSAMQASMGADVGEMADVRKQEQEQLARDMEAKNRAIQKKRAMMVAGDAPQYQQSEVQQKPVKRKKKGMVRQETATPAPKAPLQPASAIPEQAQALPPGLTAEDLALIEAVKASRARSRDTFLDGNDTVHPGATDARPERQPSPDREQVLAYADKAILEAPSRTVGRSPEFVEPSRPQQPSPEEIRERYGYGNRQQPEHPVQFPVPETQIANPAPRQSPGFHPTYVDGNGFFVPPSEAGSPGVRPYVQQPVPDTEAVRPAVSVIPTGSPRAVQDPDTGKVEIPEPGIYRPLEPMTRASAEQVQSVKRALDFQAKQEPKPFVLPGASRTFDPGVPDKDFEAFTEITGWPSHGVMYAEPVYGQALKSIDAYMLSCSDPSDLTTTLTAILGRRIRGISPEDILTADEEYLLYWLRASSLDENENGLSKLPFICPHCHKHYVDYDALQLARNLTFMNLDFENGNSPEEVAAMHREEGFVRYDLRDGRECDIYLRRRKHDRIYDEYVAGWEKANKEPFPEFRQKMLDIAVLVEIEDCETMSDKMRYIEELPLADRRNLVAKAISSQMVVTTNVSFECPACGGTVTMPYPFHRKRFVASL